MKIIAQKAALQKNGKLLILHRAETESAFPSLWDFPGGRLEKGEDLITSLKREVAEETSLVIEVGEKIGEYDRMNKNKPVHFIIYIATILDGEIKINVEHSEYRWATPEEIVTLQTMPYMKQFLKKFKSQQNGWEKLVERTGELWRNHLMVTSLPRTKHLYGFTLNAHVTTREQNIFTHWNNTAAVQKFGKNLIRKFGKNKSIISTWQQDARRYQDKLTLTTSKTLKLTKNKRHLSQILAAWKNFCAAYQSLYPPFHLSVYVDAAENLGKKFLTAAAKIRYDCRAAFNAAAPAGQALLAAISEQIKVPYEELIYLIPVEVAQTLRRKKLTPALQKIICDRKKFCVLVYQHGRTKIIAGDAGIQYAKRLGLCTAQILPKEVLHGTIAYQGKVTGPAKIIRGQADFKKIKQGDILVTPMATHSYAPLIPKVAAIITDEGGLTCHAAVLAREFKKPCIVGTKVATQAISDGQHLIIDTKANRPITTKYDKN